MRKGDYLDIAMNDMLGVAIMKRISNVTDVTSCLLLRESFLLLQLFVQLSLCSKLEDEEDSLFVTKVAVQSQDVWVSNVNGL